MTITTAAPTSPFLLTPSSKDYLWGGSRLNDDFNLGLDSDPLAEAWVCSTILMERLPFQMVMT